MSTQEFVFETDNANDLREILLGVCPVIFSGDRLKLVQIRPLDPLMEHESYPSHEAAWYLQRTAGNYSTSASKSSSIIHWQVCSIEYVWDGEESQNSTWEDLIDSAMLMILHRDFQGFAVTDDRGMVRGVENEGPFRGTDGCVTIGYRAHLHWRDQIRLSRCHIHHPK